MSKKNTYLVINPIGKKYTVDAESMHHAKNLCQPKDFFKYPCSKYKCKLLKSENPSRYDKALI